MKIKRSTLFLLLAALVLGGITILVARTQPPSSEQAETTTEQNLFSFKEDQVQSFTLDTQLEFYTFERDDQQNWQMVEPEKAPASDASIAFLLDQMVTGKSERSITVPASDRADFGLDNPLATVEVTLENQETHQLVLGGYDFNRSFIYALTDPPADENADLQVFLVSPNFENAVIRPREEWKQAAEASPSPSASPSSPAASPSASPEASPTPSPDAPEN